MSSHNIVECTRCDGRGWVHWLHPGIRLHIALSMRIVEMAQVRLYARKEPCPKCHGCGRSLRPRKRK
jgi:DnaJ-class molecular chaperone